MVLLKIMLLIAVITVSAGAITAEDKVVESWEPNSYAFSFETENGQVRDENIEIDPDSDPKSSLPKTEVNVRGSFSFISSDGYEYVTQYRAGKNGYQPYVTAHKVKPEKD